jgi:5-methylcytosine-specific restriction endonuclease McrA
LAGTNATFPQPIISPSWGLGLLFAAASGCALNPAACNRGSSIIVKKIYDLVTQARRFPPSGERKCGYCGQPTVPESGHPNSGEEDHVIPWSRGGQTEESNRKHSCRNCNRRKGSKTEGEFNDWLSRLRA